MVFIIQSLTVPSISTISHQCPSMTVLPLCPPQSFFLILPFFWPPRPKPDFLTSPTHCLFLLRRFFRPPLCRNWCFCFFFRCFRICSFVFSSDRTVRPPGVCCSPVGLWKLGLWKLGPPRPRPRPQPRPRPRPGRDGWRRNEDYIKYFLMVHKLKTACRKWLRVTTPLQIGLLKFNIAIG